MAHPNQPPTAEQLFQRYAERLVRLAEKHLSRKLTGRVDGEDVVQSAFRTFFRRSSEGQFRIDSSEQIWHLLVKITLAKARAKGRYHTAQQRDVHSEEPGGYARIEETIAEEPGPEQAVILMDQIEVLLRGLPALYGSVLEMRLQGHSAADIATSLTVSRQTIYRALELLQHRLQKGLAGNS